MSNPQRSTTVRGFVIYDELTDTYGSRIRVQQSSSASGPRVWIFADDPADPLAEPSPYLNVDQARRVRDALDAFIAEAAP